MFINEVNTSMALAFGCCYLFGGIEKKGKQKANQKWRISERLHFSGSLSAFFLETESWVLFEFRSTLFT